MKNHWYCHVEGQDYGPFTWEQLRAMAAEGRIVSSSNVRRDIDQQWFQAAQVPGLLPKAHAAGKKNGAGASAIGKSPAAARNSDSGLMAAVGGEASKSSAAIKRPQKVASNSSGNIPVGSVPVGQPVSAPPVVVKAAPAGVAVVQPAAPAFNFSVATTAPPAKADEQPEPAKKGMSPLLVVGILGGVVALVALIGVGVLIYSLTRPAQSTEEQIASALEQEMQGALEEMAQDLQSNPLSGVSPEGVAVLPDDQANSPTDDLPPSTSATAPDALAKVLKSIPDSSWKDVTQLRAIELNKLKLSVASAWLAADEAGTRVEPAAGSAAKYVFIQLRVTNVAPVVRKYKSWNVAGGTSVALADQTSAVLGLIEPTATPAAGRLSAVDLQPGQNVIDTLVFTAPSGSVEKLRLALAKSAFAENAKFKTGSHFALEIPLEVLLEGGPSPDFANSAEQPIAANRSAPPQPGEVPPAIIEPQPVSEPPAETTKPVAPAPPAKGDRPPTREELNKQFEELGKKEGQPEPKKDGQPEAKKGEAQK